jgi:hypothetical protein
MATASIAANAVTGSSAWRTMSMIAFQHPARAARSGRPPTDDSTVSRERRSNRTMT